MRAKIIRGAVNAGEDRAVGTDAGGVQGGQLVRGTSRDASGRLVRDGLSASEQQHSDVLQTACAGPEVSSAGLSAKQGGQARSLAGVADSIAKPRTADSVIRNYVRWWRENNKGDGYYQAAQRYGVKRERVVDAMREVELVRGTKPGSWGGVHIRVKTRLD